MRNFFSLAQNSLRLLFLSSLLGLCFVSTALYGQIDCTDGGTRRAFNTGSAEDSNGDLMSALPEDTIGVYGPYKSTNQCVSTGPWEIGLEIAAPSSGSFNAVNNRISGGGLRHGVDTVGGSSYCYSLTNATTIEIYNLTRIYSDETVTITASNGGTPVMMTLTETNTTLQANMTVNGGGYTGAISASTLAISANNSYTRALYIVTDGPVDEICVEYVNTGTDFRGVFGLVDYSIYACTELSAAENTQARCINGIDDDCDGLVDCADPDCADVPSAALENTLEECSDGIDNDCDGLVDCADDSCAAVAEDVGCVSVLECDEVEGIMTNPASIAFVHSESLMDLDDDGIAERLTNTLLMEEGEYGSFVSNLCADDGDMSFAGDLIIWDLTVGDPSNDIDFNSTSSRLLNNSYIRQGTDLSTAGENQFCYSFSSDVKFQVNNVGSGGFLLKGETVTVEAFDLNDNPIMITGFAPSSNLSLDLTINGTDPGASEVVAASLTFANESIADRGRWVAYSNTPVHKVCVTYGTDGSGDLARETIEDYALLVCGAPPIPEASIILCSDGKDNDCDGLIDCADPDCLPYAVAVECPEDTYLICNDGEDSDDDGDIDCDDTGCVNSDKDSYKGDLSVNCVDCAAINGVEDCTNGTDDDADGLVDCDDPDCAGCNDRCQGTAECPASLFSIKSQVLQGDGQADLIYWEYTPRGAPAGVYDYAEAVFSDTDGNGMPQHTEVPSLEASFPFLGFIDRGYYPAHTETAQLDGWLILPPGVSCVTFRLGGRYIDASSLYIGSDIGSMNLVGRINASRWYADFSFQFDDADNYSKVTVPGCSEAYTVARFRLYHYDYLGSASSVVKWDVNGAFEQIKGSAINSVNNETPPGAESIVEVTKEVIMVDANGDYWEVDGTTPRPLNPQACESLGNRVSQATPFCGCGFDSFNDTHLSWANSGFTEVTPTVEATTPLMDEGDSDEFGPFEYDLTVTSHNSDGIVADARRVIGNRVAFYNRFSDGVDDYYCMSLDFSTGPIEGVRFSLQNLYADQVFTVYGSLDGELVQPVITAPVFDATWRSPRDFKIMKYDQSCTDPMLGNVSSGQPEGTTYLIGNGYGGNHIHRRANVWFPSAIDKLEVCRGGQRGGVVWMSDLVTNKENCTDGIDNDCDGLIDCADGDCIDIETCQMDMRLEDPCRCGNPQNIFNPDGSVKLFKETLVVTNEENAPYTISGGSNIVDANGDPLAFPISLNNGHIGVDGDYEYMFYVPANEPYWLSAADDAGNGGRIEGFCNADNCACFATEELCNDGIDNDKDGTIDESDRGNCEIDCATLRSVEITGKMPITDGLATTQIWTSTTTPVACCPSQASNNVPPVDFPAGMWDPSLIPFNSVETGNANLFNHRNGDGTLLSDISSLGFRDAVGQGWGTAEQVQQDGWFVIPPGLECISFQLNGVGRADAAALYVGADFASMEIVGAAWFVGRQSGSGTDNPYSFDVNVGDLNATTFGCGWTVVRYRLYHFDTGLYSDTRVKWDIGNGYEVIPFKYIQSVGSTIEDVDSDNNRPSMEMDILAYCAFQDGDGDLVTTDGEFFVLDPRKCEKISNDPCLECTSTFVMCDKTNGLDCVRDIVNEDGTIQDTIPVCALEVFQVTPRTMVDFEGTLRTVLWDRNQTTVINNRDKWSVAFPTIAEGTCPNCLPGNDTTEVAVFEYDHLGVLDADINSEDTDGDEYIPRRAGFRGAESIQQDGWLLVPGELECIEFRLRNNSAYSSALFLGSSIDKMTMVGEYNYGNYVPGSVNNRRAEFSYEIPDDAPVIDAGCEEPLVALRVRFYHHDPSSWANSKVRWNIGFGYRVIPSKFLRTVEDECDDTPPTGIEYEEGTPFLAVRDGNGLWFTYGDPNDPISPNTHTLPDDDADMGTGNGWPNKYEQVFGVDNEINFTKVNGCDIIKSVCGGEVPVTLDTKGLCQLCIIPGLAKEVVKTESAASGIAGNIDVTFKFVLANHGGAEMENLQVNDEIASMGGFVKVISPPSVTMTSAGGTAPNPNTAYNGRGNLLDGTSGTLNDGEKTTVEVVVEIDPTYTGSSETNTATGGGKPLGSSTVFLDDSDNGSDPRPNKDETDLDDATPLQFPKIDLSKEIADVRPSSEPNLFYIDMALRVKNTGNVTVSNVLVKDNIISQLGAPFLGVTTPPSQNSDFDGISNDSIPVGTLLRNQTATILFTIEVRTPVGGSNQASVSGEGLGLNGQMILVKDLSDAGSNPESQNQSAPGGGPGSSDATSFGPGATEGPVSLSCPDRINFVLGLNCKAETYANFGGLSPNGALFAVEIYVDGEHIGNTLTSSHLGKEITYKFIDVSSGQSCWGHIILEQKRFPATLTSSDTTDCLWYEQYEWPKFDLDKDLAKDCYPAPIGGQVRHNLSKTEMGCDSILYVRTSELDFSVDKKKTTRVLRRDSLLVIPIVKDDVCYPATWVDVDCDILGKDYDLDVSKNEDHNAISELLSPSKLYTYLKEKKVPGYDTMTAPYLKKYKEAKQDSIVICIEEAKHPSGESEAVKVVTHAGDSVWTLVPIYKYVCIKLDTIKVAKCDDFVLEDDHCERKDPMTGSPIAWPKDSVACLGTYTTKDTIAVPFSKGTTCNIFVKCTDWVIEGECENLPTVMRNWEIINWCDPTHNIWDTTQWIRVIDNTPPEITPGKDVWANVAPWTCSGSVHLTPEVKDWSGYHVTYEVSVGTVTYAEDGKSAWITDLWLGNGPIDVKCTAYDWCGNSSVDNFKIYVQDQVAPVAIAEDQINVSLTGEHDAADQGVAKISKESIDAGSHDTGCGKIFTCVLRKSELDDPIYDYKGDPVYDEDGNQCFYPHGCDGIYDKVAKVKVGYDNVKKEDIIEEVPAVICKDFVKVCCADDYAVTGEHVQVALVVKDFASQASFPGHPVEDNYNHSWTDVKVENKAGLFVECKDAVVTCDGPNYVAGKLTPPKAWNICGEVELISKEEGEIDACGNGEIVVRWTYDGKIVCTQTLTGTGSSPTGGSDFDPYTIKWPRHQDGTDWEGVNRECVDSGKKDADGNKIYVIEESAKNIAMGDAQECTGTPMGAPVWCNPNCTLIGSNYKDETVAVNGSDYCKKIIRSWTVIDWCEWKPNSDDIDDENDTANDEFQAVDDTWMPNEVAANAKDGESCIDCEKTNGTADRVFIRYTKVDRDGYYTYDQVIKVVDFTAPEIVVEEEVEVSITGGNGVKIPEGYDVEEDEDGLFDDCIGYEPVLATVSDLCGEDLILETADATWWVELYEVIDGKEELLTSSSGTGASFEMNTGKGKPGDVHIIRWQAKDGCGNTGHAATTVTFVDDKDPTPVCIQDLSSAIMVNGTVDIWASDYDLGSFDNCGGVEVTFIVDSLGRSVADYAEGSKVGSVTVDCDYLDGGGSVQLFMFAVDNYGNSDYCVVNLAVQDVDNVCGQSNTGASTIISGSVSTAIGDMVESTEVALNVGAKSSTSIDGSYAFNSVMNNIYQVRAKKDDDYMNGVSTLDLILIQQHVLGVQTLDSPYKVISADINSDEKITALDLVELRKLILGVYTDLPNNDSWRFVDAEQSFDDAVSPFPFAEQLSVNLGTNAVSGQNFIAAKIGDVSGNAIANSAIASEGRSLGTVNLQIVDASVKAGELVNVAVSANAFNDVAAYQFTMDVVGLEFVSVTSGAVEMTKGNFGILDNKTITAAWYNTTGVTTDEALFTMTFKATSSVTLSDAIAISSRVTKAEAYTVGSERLDLGLEFNSKSVSTFALYQNEPNPFHDATVISFELPKAGQATLNIFDVTGKSVLVRTENFAKGSNQFELRKTELNTTGVMYYQLESGEFTATKKMILIE